MLFTEQLHDARYDRTVRSGENGQSDDLNVFLQRRAHDHFGSLAQAGVNHFHARIAEGAGNYLDATVVSVEAGFGYKHPDPGVHIYKPIIERQGQATG